jgi:probable phosphomutase (TIGR03848 family)
VPRAVAGAGYPSPMALLLLVRHALTDATGRRLSGQEPGLHLSETGRAQAEHLAARLSPIPLAAMYSSPLERCVETAEIVAAGRSVEIRLLPELMEVDYGRWTGRPLPQLYRTALWKRLQQAPSSIRFPNGETLAEVQLRCVSALDEIAARHARKAVAVVAHADVIRLTLAHYAGIHIDLYQRLTVSPASVSALSLGDRIPRVIRVNDTGSVEDLAPKRPARRQAPRPSHDGRRLR